MCLIYSKREFICMCVYVLCDLVSGRRDSSFYFMRELVRFNQGSTISRMDICVFVSLYVCKQGIG